MRIIGGKFRSRRLKSPGKLLMRPTSDRLRETLFNVLGPAVKDSLFLDLYAGTGAIGIEAISRGAREVIFAEAHAVAAQLVRENLKSLGIDDGFEVMEGDAVRALEKIAKRHLLADFIFLDPPYDAAGEDLRVLDFLDASHLVAPYGLVIVEHGVKSELPQRLDRLELIRLLEQGDAALSFYRLALAA
jgi:16S rRNA (guanine966-N2)-methyltransferase